MICQQFFSSESIPRRCATWHTFVRQKEQKSSSVLFRTAEISVTCWQAQFFVLKYIQREIKPPHTALLAAAPYASQDPKKDFGDLLRGIFLSFIIHDSFILCQAFFRSFFGRLKGAFHFLKLNIPKIGLFFPLKDTIRRQFMHRKHAVTSAIGWSGKSRCKAVFPVGYANDGIKSVMIFTDPSTVRSSGVRKEYYLALRTRSECYQKFVLQASDNTLNFLDAI